MLENIIEAVVSSVIVAMIFEIWSKRKALLKVFHQSTPKAPTSQQEIEGHAALDAPTLDPSMTSMPQVGNLQRTEEGTAPPRSEDLRQTESGLRRRAKNGLRRTKKMTLSIWSLFKMMMRLAIAALSGFIIGGLTAGVMEAEGYTEIALGSGVSLWLIFIPTLLVWFLLYRFGPLKSKAI